MKVSWDDAHSCWGNAWARDLDKVIVCKTRIRKLVMKLRWYIPLETLPFQPIALLYFSLFLASLGLNNEVVASHNWWKEPKAKSTETKLLACAWCKVISP